MNIICFGDSITHARNFAECDRWPSILQHMLNEWRPNTYKVYNKGIGGNTTSQGLDRLHEDVRPHLPGLLMLEFGFNDANVRDWLNVPRVGLAEYVKNLREFHRLAISSGGRCAFIINHKIKDGPATQGNDRTYRDNFLPYNKAQRELAQELAAPIIDLPGIMDETDIDLDAFLADDGLHLSVKGNHQYAQMVFEAVKGILGDEV